MGPWQVLFPLLLHADNNELSSQGGCEEITIEIVCTVLGSSQDKGAMLIDGGPSRFWY